MASRRIAFADFHRLPGVLIDRSQRHNTLEHGEIITAIELAQQDFGDHHTYLKLRDRASYAFALVSVAVGLRIEGGTIARARIALGGVAHKPWRNPGAEALLEGNPAGEQAFESFAEALLTGARAHSHNGFKIPLARKAVVRALTQAAAGTPQSQTLKTIL